MDEQGRFFTTEKEVVKVLLDPPPIPAIISLPPPPGGELKNQALPAPPAEPRPNPDEDSAWAALAGAAIILNPLLEDLAATHLSKKNTPETAKPFLKKPEPKQSKDLETDPLE